MSTELKQVHLSNRGRVSGIIGKKSQLTPTAPILTIESQAQHYGLALQPAY